MDGQDSLGKREIPLDAWRHLRLSNPAQSCARGSLPRQMGPMAKGAKGCGRKGGRGGQGRRESLHIRVGHTEAQAVANWVGRPASPIGGPVDEVSGKGSMARDGRPGRGRRATSPHGRYFFLHNEAQFCCDDNDDDGIMGDCVLAEREASRGDCHVPHISSLWRSISWTPSMRSKRRKLGSDTRRSEFWYPSLT
ncbi:hypothetical protein LZ30DRAFT_241407 [Colletotrichum cereale]|nr:hypothetical protein LZ30DRAFT_241407 [Colletotrichum cereale]